jgi:transposase
MSRKRRSSKKTGTPVLHSLNPHAAGVDIGATEIYIGVPADRDPQPVRHFSTFPEDLHAAADWLKSCNIETVAMESTGVYWIPFFQILEARGLQVFLVNAHHVKNVPGRKSDVSDCQWLQYLHSVGLLRGSFRPEQEVCTVRSILRHRDGLVQMASSHVQHLQKALDQMNLQLHHVISDITGMTGLAIIEAILAGERNPQTLAKLRDWRIKATESTIAKSLVGDYRREHLFPLGQSLAAYRHYQELIGACDKEIEQYLKTFESKADPPEDPKWKSQDGQKTIGGKPGFDLQSHLYRIFGVDLTQIQGCTRSRRKLFLRRSVVRSRTERPRPSAWRRNPSIAAHPTSGITFAGCELSWETRQAYDETICVQNESQNRQRLEARLRKQARDLGLEITPAKTGAV